MNENNHNDPLIKLLNDEIFHFSLNDESAYKHIADTIGNARLVLLGEATHGTQEFYEARIKLSQYLIKHKDFQAIAIEGDLTNTWPMNLYLFGEEDILSPERALTKFNQFPAWMWRNKAIPPFLYWLREHNDKLELNKKIGIYGLDLYCLNAAMQSVIVFLKKNYPKAANIAIQRYACFDHAGLDPQAYGYFVDAGLQKSCIEEVSKQLYEIQKIAYSKFHLTTTDFENTFYALQNARTAKNAEHYYRALFDKREVSWNIRDHHMTETLHNLITHVESKFNKPAKIIIWAHNSHVGDARATEMTNRNEINLGQLVRERFTPTSYHLGFSTFSGTVTAASDWDTPAKIKKIAPGLPGSYEALFHSLKFKNFFLNLHENEVHHLLEPYRLQRAIGVVYRPETERMSHYFFTHLPNQFDAIIHMDITQAVQPVVIKEAYEAEF